MSAATNLHWQRAVTFIGDRFVSLGHAWLDIVTGRRVSLRVGAAPADVGQRARVCRERMARIQPGELRLVDFGRQGATTWFEALGVEGAPAPVEVRELAWPQACEWAGAIADGRLGGHLAIHAPHGAGFGMLCEQLARRLRDSGFVTIRADAAVPLRLRRQLLHRHVALIVADERARASAAGWLTELAIVSDRRHALIERVTEPEAGAIRLRPFSRQELMAAVAGGSGDVSRELVSAAAIMSGGWPAAFVRELAARASSSNVARERAVAFGVPPTPAVDRGLARAAAYGRRRRPIAESQWHSAAVAAAERRGDVGGYARAMERWVERLLEGGRYSRALTVTARGMAESMHTAARIPLTILSARAHLAAGRITRAETLASAAIELERLSGRSPSPAATAVRTEALFWQGRWQELRGELAAGRTAETLVWQSLVEWADRGQIAAPCADGAGWMPFASHAFAIAASGTPQDLRSCCARSRGIAAPWRAAIVAQAWLELGHEHEARASLEAARLRHPAELGLVDAVLTSLRRALGLEKPDRRWLDDLVRRERLRGLARWGQGRANMQMLRDMATLMDIVQGAEDECAGLSAICDWLRTAAGASASAVVTPIGEVLAGESTKSLGVEAPDVARWSERGDPVLDEGDDRALARAPVRFAGALAGYVIVTGPVPCGRAMFDAAQAAATVCGALVRSRLDALAAGAHGDALAGEILGASPAIRGVRAAVARIALAPFPVVIEGESGTGKELVARALHRQSPRRDRAFAPLNCAALTDELIEAELFGHARGAFTHALNARAGLFEEAHHGTLFLDEVGELSPRAQAKLLRALQEGEIRRVGENDARPVDVRVIAATNRPLAGLAAEGRFRDDLMFRLSVVKITVPPLRERPEDVPQLALEFWRAAARRVGTRATLGPDAISLLSQLPWPGNVRQLQNAMAALSVAAPKAGRVGARLIRQVLDGLVDAGATEIIPLDEARRQVERRVVAAALAKHTGSRTEAARALGLSRQGLSKVLRRLGLAEAGAA